jgi:spermidine/putrescine transport system permease protein
MLYLPIILIALQSVNKYNEMFTFGGFTLDWYGKIFSHDALRTEIINTFLVSITATIISTVLGTLIAVGIHSMTKKNRQLMIMLNNIPILNADIVTGLSLMILFSVFLPLFPRIFGFPTLLLAHMFFIIPYVILNVLPKLSEVDPNLMDAALDLGVKPFRALAKVLVPAIKAGIFSGMLLAFTMSLEDFVVSYFTTGNGFGNLSIWIYGSMGKKSLTPSVYAFTTLMNIVILAMLLLVNIKGPKRIKNSIIKALSKKEGRI